MKVGDLVKLKDQDHFADNPTVCIVISVDSRPGCGMCTLVGPMTDGKPAAYLMKHFEVINE